MTVIECPKCTSKFKIEKDILARESIKMRCSVCSHVFTYSPPAEKQGGESDFDLLIGTNDGELQEKPLQEDLSKSLEEGMPQEIVESPKEEEQPQEAAPAEEEAEPESVIREIDAILGADQEAAAGTDEGPAVREVRKGMSLKAKAAVALLVLVLAGAGIWIMKDALPFAGKAQKELENPVLERGPFFSIPEGNVTYEILTNNSEGDVLVVKGVIKKLTTKPLKSIMVEARVYDKANTLMESRNTYAGIIPESSELMRQKSSDIHSLLTAEPRTLGVLETSPDIPFSVVFFGRSAREAAAFKVEVKEFHWK